jgi:hypothetical protein
MIHRKSPRRPRADARKRPATSATSPAAACFTPIERRLVGRLRTPLAVQRLLNQWPYNTEPPPFRDTLRSFRQVLRHKTAHCLEAALFAACVLEQHGYPPLVMSLESADLLDHVIFVYCHRGRWGSIGRSRDPGLHGRKAVYRSPRALALSYFDAYVDDTGSLTGFAVVDLRGLGAYDWRFSRRNVWKAERLLLEAPHQRIARRPKRVKLMRKRYRVYREKHGKKPLFYNGRKRWTAIPGEFL